mmetsp:Transcript_20452/g.48371  ORF Transcript_20452/g.48371 Transcript_20452/m.48371 type:complete len:685 (-) Transcript_20452:88-2142(-)
MSVCFGAIAYSVHRPQKIERVPLAFSALLLFMVAFMAQLWLRESAHGARLARATGCVLLPMYFVGLYCCVNWGLSNLVSDRVSDYLLASIVRTGVPVLLPDAIRSTFLFGTAAAALLGICRQLPLQLRSCKSVDPELRLRAMWQGQVLMLDAWCLFWAVHETLCATAQQCPSEENYTLRVLLLVHHCGLFALALLTWRPRSRQRLRSALLKLLRIGIVVHPHTPLVALLGIDPANRPHRGSFQTGSASGSDAGNAGRFDPRTWLFFKVGRARLATIAPSIPSQLDSVSPPLAPVLRRARTTERIMAEAKGSFKPAMLTRELIETFEAGPQLSISHAVISSGALQRGSGGSGAGLSVDKGYAARLTLTIGAHVDYYSTWARRRRFRNRISRISDNQTPRASREYSGASRLPSEEPSASTRESSSGEPRTSVDLSPLGELSLTHNSRHVRVRPRASTMQNVSTVVTGERSLGSHSSRNGNPFAARRVQRPQPIVQLEPAVDYIVVHSLTDGADQKRAALLLWLCMWQEAQDFPAVAEPPSLTGRHFTSGARPGPAVLFESWLTSSPAEVLVHLAHLPFHMARARKLLVLCSVDFLRSFEAVAQLYVWIATGGSLDDVVLVPLGGPTAAEDVLSSLDAFHVMWIEPVANRQVQERLVRTVEIASVSRFNEVVRSFIRCVPQGAPDEL